MKVNLIDYARDPLEKLYGAYRTCYTAKTPDEVWSEVRSEYATAAIGPLGTFEAKLADHKKKVSEFVQERLKTGHTSPLEQVVFWFGISGVSRALSHQFVRHRIGISFEQQSQRYVKYKEDGQFDFVTPPSVQKNDAARAEYELFLARAQVTYKNLCGLGVPNEDARFVLPNAMPTNFQIMVNFAELLHIGDLRLCHRAQWEIRYMVGLMRAEIRRVIPELAAVMQPKCGEARKGYCDETLKDYFACPLSKVRPHKQLLFEAYEHLHAPSGEGARALTDADIQPKEG